MKSNYRYLGFKEQFDVYTVGVTIMQLINGKLPTRMNRVVAEDKKKFYDPKILGLIERMVAMEPEHRPTFQEISDATENLAWSPRRRTVPGFETDDSKIFEGWACYVVFPLFHDFILMRANEDENSKFNFGDEMFKDKEELMEKIERCKKKKDEKNQSYQRYSHRDIYPSYNSYSD